VHLKAIYIFGKGREYKIFNHESSSKEFLYGFDYISKLFDTSFLVPIENKKKTLIFLEKIARKLTNLPIYFSNYCSFESYKKIFDNQKVIVTNDSIGLSLLPILLVGKFLKKVEISIFIMGLLGKPKPNMYFKIIQRIIINLLFSISKNIIFLGKAEYQKANLNYKKHIKKFYFLPFPVDIKFWDKNLCKENTDNKYDITFIGNDGKRDYKFLIKLIRDLKNYDFNVVTSNTEIIKGLEGYKNVKLILGHINENILSDEEIREIYNKSKFVIVPLIDTIQPSGQSVALQAMSMEVPVIITDTIGFWDSEKLINNESIIKLHKNEVKLWRLKIQDLFDNDTHLKKIIQNATSIVRENYTYENFTKKLSGII